MADFEKYLNISKEATLNKNNNLKNENEKHHKNINVSKFKSKILKNINDNTGKPFSNKKTLNNIGDEDYVPGLEELSHTEKKRLDIKTIAQSQPRKLMTVVPAPVGEGHMGVNKNGEAFYLSPYDNVIKPIEKKSPVSKKKYEGELRSYDSVMNKNRVNDDIKKINKYKHGGKKSKKTRKQKKSNKKQRKTRKH
jgi:hypothetical protein